MSDARLPAGVWIEAGLRRLDVSARSYYVVHKGAWASGTVLLKINRLQGECRLLGQIRDENGALGWGAVLKSETVAEADADAYIRRAIDRDPDVWVIEIEDREGNNPFAESLVSG